MMRKRKRNGSYEFVIKGKEEERMEIIKIISFFRLNTYPKTKKINTKDTKATGNYLIDFQQFSMR